MRKYILFLLLFIGYYAGAQNVDTTKLQPFVYKGAQFKIVKVDSAFILPKFGDTLYKYAGALKYINGSLYYADGSKWKLLGGGSGSGTVTSFSAGNLSPLFTTSVANATTTPALSFTLSNAAGYTLYGRGSGTGTPSFLTSIDSNWIPALHSEAYYNTKYLKAAPTWQATLDATNGKVLTADNTIAGAQKDFVFDNNKSFTINAGTSNGAKFNINSDEQIVLSTATTNFNVTPSTIEAASDVGFQITGGLFSDNITVGNLGTSVYTLPNTDGTNGQVMTTNGMGLVTWQNAGSGSSLFPTSGTGTATGDVTGDLGGNLLDVINGQYQFTVNSNENNWRIYDYERDNYPVNIDADNKRIQFNQADDNVYRTIFNGTNGDYPVTVRGTGSGVGGYGLINFGIQTSGSEAGIQLDNTGTGGTSRGIIVTNDASGIGGNKLGFTNAGASRTDMVIDGSGNVGIGTTTPAYTLDVNGTAHATSIQLDNGSFRANAMSPFVINLDGSDFQIFAGTNSLTFNQNALTLTGDNAVLGIGTSTPSANLDLVGTFKASSISGLATLSSGIATVNNSLFTSYDNVLVTAQNCSSCGSYYITNKTKGSFDIVSSDASDASDIFYFIIK